MSKKKVSFWWAVKEFIWPRRSIVLIGIVLIIIKSLSGLVLPYASKNLIDEVWLRKNNNSKNENEENKMEIEKEEEIKKKEFGKLIL